MRGRALIRSLEDEVGRRFHQFLEAPVDALLGPPLALQVLNPLEVADCNAARTPKDVGDHPHASVLEEPVALEGGRVVRDLEDEVGLDAIGIVDPERLFERRGG
jgi:hypothetical protein